VQDEGIGIPEQDQKHLFERFYRASNAGVVQGTGLGLHIMRHYVDMLHGTVKINSEVGKGTTVSVTLDKSAGADNNQPST
jgi:signal transduction histidine kinase